jgi:hypothetical protein
VKHYKVTSPALKIKTRQGFIRIPRGLLQVEYSERLRVPWEEMRRMVACAYRHVRTEAAREHNNREPYDNPVTFKVNKIVTLHLRKASFGWHGRAGGYTARVYIGKLYTVPRRTTYPNFKDMPVYWVTDWKERCVDLIAHELWHCFGRGGSGKKAEFDCEMVAWDCVEAWRKLNGYTFATPPEVDGTPVSFCCAAPLQPQDNHLVCSKCESPLKPKPIEHHEPVRSQESCQAV